MRYIRAKDDLAARRVAGRELAGCGNIDRSGSVKGMQSRFGWRKGEQVRIGGYIYNVGRVGLDKLRAAGLVRGE